MDRASQAKNTALLVAYHYPPLRSTGVERSAKFARYLAEFGYDATVLTTSAFGGDDDNTVRRAWEPLSAYRWLFNRQARRDPTAAARVRTEAGVVRRWARGARRLLVPDAQLTWIPAASLRALQALCTGEVRLVYSSYPPASAHLVALFAKQVSGVPWVADFRDSWTSDPLDPELLQRPHRRQLERRLEAAVVGAADVVIASTRIAADNLRASYPEHADRIRVITNGFDPADLAAAGDDGSGARALPGGVDGQRRLLQLVHTGSFSGSHPCRSPKGLLAALRALLESDATWPQRLQLTLVGRLTRPEIDATADLTASGMVRLVEESDRNTALQYQRSADVLLLVDHPRAWPASNLPTKLFEYLACRRPILALCTAGMVAETMAELGAGLCAPPDEPAAIARAIGQLEEAGARGVLQRFASTAPLERFHRRALTRQLAACFDSVLERHGSTAHP